MKYSQLLSLLCLLVGICSCSTDNYSSEIESSDLIGHWNISLPSGLQFIEFIPNDKVLIGDRGALGIMDVSQHYIETYELTGANRVEGLPSDSRMENISITGDRMTFDFVNPETGYKIPYSATREDNYGSSSESTNMLNRLWLTTEQNGVPIAIENQKTAYFSKAGIYALTDPHNDSIDMFSWNWSSEAEDQLCYTRYQRPTRLPDETCMDFIELSSSQAVFYVDGIVIKLEARLDI